MKTFKEHREYMNKHFGKMPSKSKALNKMSKHEAAPWLGRKLSETESKEKIKNWPK